jgi:hypothetical protein
MLIDHLKLVKGSNEVEHRAISWYICRGQARQNAEAFDARASIEFKPKWPVL